MLNYMSKVMEKHVYDCFYDHLISHKLHSPFLSGFRIRPAFYPSAPFVDKGLLLVELITVDLHKAFDLLNMDIPLFKLS